MLVCHDQTRIRARHEITVDSPRKGSKQVVLWLFRIFPFPLFVAAWHCAFILVSFLFGGERRLLKTIECTLDRREDNDKDVLFHVFWKDHVRHQQWVQDKQSDVGKSFRISRSTSVLSNHFLDSDYVHRCKKWAARVKLSAVQAVLAWGRSEAATGESLQQVRTSSKSPVDPTKVWSHFWPVTYK